MNEKSRAEIPWSKWNWMGLAGKKFRPGREYMLQFKRSSVGGWISMTNVASSLMLVSRGFIKAVILAHRIKQ